MIETTSLAAAVVVLAVAFLFRQSIIKLIETHYSNLKKDQVKRSYYLVLFLAVILVVAVFEFGGVVFEPTQPEQQVEEIPETPKSDAQVITEALVDVSTQVMEEAKEIKEQNRVKDSLYDAEHERTWVYQIGTSKTKKVALERYNGLKSIKGICLFRDNKKSYRVILQEPNATESSLKANLSFLQESLPNLNEEIKIVDLADFCSRKEVVLEKALKSDYGTVRCYECRKNK